MRMHQVLRKLFSTDAALLLSALRSERDGTIPLIHGLNQSSSLKRCPYLSLQESGSASAAILSQDPMDWGNDSPRLGWGKYAVNINTQLNKNTNRQGRTLKACMMLTLSFLGV